MRAGVNIGDIIIDDNDIFGNGVNVAARLEELAEPGTNSSAGCIAARTVFSSARFRPRPRVS